jgi:hypothetical protein
VFAERTKSFCIVILLLVSTAANGAPTVATIDKVISSSVHIVSDTSTVITPSIEAIETVDTKLANLGTELLQPPASFSGLSDTQGNYVKSLPALPAAVLMVLSGFLCVSLVRDRRIWLAALTGLLLAGQTGIQVLPRLVLRLSHGSHSKQQLCAELIYPHQLENSLRLRSDIDGTQYIGLLHHLAGIPDTNSRYLHKATYTSQLDIIIAQTGLCLFLVCLASRTEQLIPFSPAFIFANLARGPPILA